MKKSEQYHAAMKLVLNSGQLTLDEKIEIMETLINDKKLALYSEEQAAEIEIEEDAE